MSNKNKHLRGVIYSTDPHYKLEEEQEGTEEKISNQKQQLRVRIEKHHRGGKTVTIVDGFIGTDDDKEQLGKLLRQKCGTGGSVKDGLILMQGEMKERVIKLLIELGFKNSR